MRIPLKIKFLKGELALPGDKSIANRVLLTAMLADGESQITNLPISIDILNALSSLSTFGINSALQIEPENLIIKGGRDKILDPNTPINCGNSGTLMRLLCGISAGFPFKTTLTGDASLSKRPMERVADPLRTMGSEIETNNGFPPLTINGKFPLKPIDYELPMPSAQVKSSIIYAATAADGTSRIVEPIPSRDHTEILFETLCPANFKKIISQENTIHEIKGGFIIPPFNINIPGDPSSAAYLVALALLLPDSEILLKRLLLNPRRIKYIEILKRMGANIEVSISGKETGELYGDVVVKSSNLKNIQIDGDDIPLIIDEIPMLAAVATKSQGEMIIRGASELRFKESDRISALVHNLRMLGCEIDEFTDGFSLIGSSNLHSGRLDHFGDHRILMSLMVVSIAHRLNLDFIDFMPINISFPEFTEYLQILSSTKTLKNP